LSLDGLRLGQFGEVPLRYSGNGITGGQYRRRSGRIEGDDASESPDDDQDKAPSGDEYSAKHDAHMVDVGRHFIAASNTADRVRSKKDRAQLAPGRIVAALSRRRSLPIVRDTPFGIGLPLLRLVGWWPARHATSPQRKRPLAQTAANSPNVRRAAER
jgi:hypothetical protein